MTSIEQAIRQVHRTLEFIDRQRDDAARALAVLNTTAGASDLTWGFWNGRLAHLDVQRAAAVALLQDLEPMRYRAEFVPVPRAKPLKVPLRRPRAERKRA